MKKTIQEHNDRVYVKTHRTPLTIFIGGMIYGILICLLEPIVEQFITNIIKAII